MKNNINNNKDYKYLYQKYKQKYLESKNNLEYKKNIFTGGSSSVYETKKFSMIPKYYDQLHSYSDFEEYWNESAGQKWNEAIPEYRYSTVEEYKDKLYNFNEFNEYPNYLSLLSYDLIGLIYYLTLENSILDADKLFKRKNSFKGKIGVFDVENNQINHRLNFYKINDGKFIKIF